VIHTGLTPFHEARAVRPFLGAQASSLLDVRDDGAPSTRLAIEDCDLPGATTGKQDTRQVKLRIA
jgi:hypothetical protein